MAKTDTRAPVAVGLETPTAPHGGVSWLELFYDLVLIACIVSLSTAVSHHQDEGTIATAIVAFGGIWWIWIETTEAANRLGGDDGLLRRAIVLVQMFLLTLVALGAADHEHGNIALVTLSFAGLFVLLGAIYVPWALASGPLRAFARVRVADYATCALLCVLGVVPSHAARLAVWTLAAAIALTPSFRYRFGDRPNEPPFDEAHLVERMGLLTLVVLGEAFIKVALVAAEGRLDDMDVVVMAFIFVLTFGLWWTYFDDVPSAGLPASPVLVRLWIVCHFFLHLGIVGAVVAVARFLPLSLEQALAENTLLLLVVPLVIVYVSLTGIGYCSRRPPAATLALTRLATASIIGVLAVVSRLYPHVNAEETVIAVALLVLVQACASAIFRRRATPQPSTAP